MNEDLVHSTERLLWKSAFCYILSYCPGGDSTANISRLFTAFERSRNCSRPKRLTLSISQKQPSIFVFWHRAALLQPHSQNINLSRVGRFKANDIFSIFVDHCRKRTTDFGRGSSMLFCFTSCCTVFGIEKRRQSFPRLNFFAVKTWARLSSD